MEIKEDKNKESSSSGRAFSLVYQIVFTIVFSVLFFLFVGKKLDEWLGTSFVFTFVGLMLGVVGGGYVVYKEIEKL
ncbi:MAG: AtpZ/AtpI family protein [Candidatus Riflemargulisbacteria bacterium]